MDENMPLQPTEARQDVTEKKQPASQIPPNRYDDEEEDEPQRPETD